MRGSDRGCAIVAARRRDSRGCRDGAAGSGIQVEDEGRGRQVVVGLPISRYRAAAPAGGRWADLRPGRRRNARFARRSTGSVPAARAATLTLVDFVEEYLLAHPGQRGDGCRSCAGYSEGDAELGDVRLIELTPEQVCTWRMSVPEGHRYEATQALRQVLNRAVAWKLLDYNPAKRGVPNPRPAEPGEATVRFLARDRVGRRRSSGRCTDR